MSQESYNKLRPYPAVDPGTIRSCPLPSTRFFPSDAILETQKLRSLSCKLCQYDTGERSRDSSLGIALGYGLDDWGSRVRFPAGAGNFSPHHRVQNGSEAHPTSYPRGTGGSFPGVKAAGV
jgi:hypothetical protein